MTNMAAPSADDYTVALIYIKPLEMMAITPMLDERLSSVPVALGDLNDYTLGRIGDHNVIIVGPARGDQGTIATAQFVTTIRLTFPNITVGLLVGIGGGIPRYPENDVRLGDIVVGAPETGPAVVQYDLGKRTIDGFELTRNLSKPPGLLLQVVNKVEDKLMCLQDGEVDILKPHLDRFLKYPRLKRDYQKPSAPDRLFKSEFLHERHSECSEHSDQFEQIREPRESDHIFIHHGTILSGDTVMKSSKDRDMLSDKHKNALCFEMEAAGLMDVFPCLVIRGICDYADSHKNDAWQPYAAAAAAAYAREILLNMTKHLPRTPEIRELVKPIDEETPVDSRSHYTAVFSSSRNSGVQVGHNTGNMTNTFGRKG
ncbi:hypothetical protein E0Z10_g9350 [Xylaria hypoxylon]|uniref:Fungal death-pathway protein SesB domain-containing protein n=1 Tax=Xylaria hypoxylon TaxID=37992 RepID=A0A4Z0YL80_9PEZI|nr:hypothetical protein E0Z10_g9350 [Xylaria hypoxylon]